MTSQRPLSKETQSVTEERERANQPIAIKRPGVICGEGGDKARDGRVPALAPSRGRYHDQKRSGV